MTIGNRLKIARKKARLTQAGLSAKSGVKQAMISKLETNKSHETGAIVPLALACGVRPEWLHSDDGPMTGDSPKRIKSDVPQVSPGEKQMLDMWRLMPDETKFNIWTMMYGQVAKGNPTMASLFKRDYDAQMRANTIYEKAQDKLKAKK